MWRLKKFVQHEYKDFLKEQEEVLSQQHLEKGNRGRWSRDEHNRFIEGLKLFGKDWKQIEEHIGSRSGAQIRSHA